MNKVLFACLFLFISINTFSQEDSTSSKNKFDSLINNSSALLKTELHELIIIGKSDILGKVAYPLKFEVIKIENLFTNEKINGIKVHVPFPVNKYTVIDKEEVYAFIKALKIIKKDVLTSKPDVRTDVIFSTPSGLVVSCIPNARDKWKVNFGIDKVNKATYTIITEDDIENLIKKLEEVIPIL